MQRMRQQLRQKFSPPRKCLSVETSPRVDQGQQAETAKQIRAKKLGSDATTERQPGSINLLCGECGRARSGLGRVDPDDLVWYCNLCWAAWSQDEPQFSVDDSDYGNGKRSRPVPRSRMKPSLSPRLGDHEPLKTANVLQNELVSTKTAGRQDGLVSMGELSPAAAAKQAALLRMRHYRDSIQAEAEQAHGKLE